MPTVAATVMPAMAAVMAMMAVMAVMAASESEDNARSVAVAVPIAVIVTDMTMTPPMTVAPMAVAIWSVMDLLSGAVSLMYLCSG
ncbi:MAG: hypothetical protein K8F92_04970 [Hyphomicrobium sp.]|uniref:hypothetical protein n=1 Tax=Hyphomicrobium sp. TaxID=82 RepID=UPI0025BAEA23|nr:hypothetical protein [Hyphomicrobium sp.]MBZ0208988.1 hypothetical protein [Hyphomicrobium sp.]